MACGLLELGQVASALLCEAFGYKTQKWDLSLRRSMPTPWERSWES